MAIRAGAIEAALSDLVQERLIADFEESSCLRAVPPHSLENLFYSCRLGSHGRFFGDLLESKALTRGPRGSLILGRNESGRGSSGIRYQVTVPIPLANPCLKRCAAVGCRPILSRKGTKWLRKYPWTENPPKKARTS